MKKTLTIILFLFIVACGNTPPTAPKYLKVRAVADSKISVTWLASFDNGGIREYEIWRDNKFHDSARTTGYLDSGLSNSTAHCYCVRAIGNYDDISEFTRTLCAKTFPYEDLAPPTPPGNLALEVLSDTEIKLTWDASTDDLAVAGYNVYKDTTLINTTSITSFINTGLINSTTYCYVVTAIDRVDNESLETKQQCGTTLPPP